MCHVLEMRNTRTLVATLLALVFAASAQAANIVIKNDTVNTPKLEVFQGKKLLSYVNSFEPGDTFVVPVNAAGKKPLLVITQFNHHSSILLPVKNKPLFFQLSWLTSVAR